MVSEQESFDGGMTARVRSEDLKRFQMGRKRPVLQVLQGPDAGLRITIDGPELTLGRYTAVLRQFADEPPRPDEQATAGRPQGSMALLHDEQISRRHCTVRYDEKEGACTLVDLRSTNGTKVNLLPITETPLKDGDTIFVGSTVLKFALMDDIESEHVDLLHRWAFFDDLTGLIIRHRFYHQLRFEVNRSMEQGEKLALLMMDMDGLKQINDANGHPTGAFIIGQVGRIIGEIANPLGQASRFGGDEFVAYLLNHDLEKGMAVGERIRLAVQDHIFEMEGKQHRVSISIGVVVLPDAAKETEALNKAADDALYRAKKKGRNCVSA